MHVRVMTGGPQDAVVWLEQNGVRAFEVVGADELPIGAVEELRGWVTSNRQQVENEWLKYILAMGWLQVRAKGIYINVTVYPHFDTEIVREIDLSACPCWVTDEDVAVEGHELVIGVGKPEKEQARLELRHVLWEGADDGSDAEAQPL
jgi:hypothetical protein